MLFKTCHSPPQFLSQLILLGTLSTPRKKKRLLIMFRSSLSLSLDYSGIKPYLCMLSHITINLIVMIIVISIMKFKSKPPHYLGCLRKSDCLWKKLQLSRWGADLIELHLQNLHFISFATFYSVVFFASFPGCRLF